MKIFKTQFNKIKNNRGISMVELLFYTAVFSVLFLVIINSMIFMTRAFRETVVNTDLTQGASVMERMSREIRKSSGINTISATSLRLDQVDPLDSATTRIRFTLSGSDIELYDSNDVLVGDLNSPNISITSLTFTQITTNQGIAVRIAMTVRSNHYNSVRTEDFYNTVVLRQAY